ncbi:MAG TPA: maltose alpha-D-glucosyltransferase [Ignavibacteriales bacterium]|nr:maltose alpha-D-glucosyltransferase [Ignavibacteriales bacterium]
MTNGVNDNPYWYKDGIIYQVHVKVYRDSDNNGMGDFRGLIEKLDYIQSLGATIIWLQPFYPSPLKDDGYDIADYFSVNPDYGTIEDLKEFLKESHKRGIKVITELVMNHTSDQHALFQQARVSPPGSPQRDFYVWNDSPDKYKEARIIFQDFETSNWTWDPKARSYYWHRFYSHQPDFNFDNPHVHRLMQRILDFWLDMGVDGLRLDAVPYLYEREGTNCENLSETHEYLKKIRAYVDRKYKNKIFLAEANQWPEDAVAYFGNGDECHMAFHFPIMPRIFMSIQMEDRFPIIDIMEQTPQIPDNCQWAMFLRNHDELTLEMVTDEERDYMYRFYAKDKKSRINLGIRRRLAPLVENNRRKIELMNILLFSFPGTPIIYYGDEIGMGDNYYLGDRNGVRTPMHWSPDRNAGFSDANPQKLYLPVIIDPEYHYEAVNVDVQSRNSSSLLLWMKKAIAIRKSFKAFSRGSLDFLSPTNPKILAFVRKYEEETVLVVVNLSRFSQYVEIDLSKYEGFIPIEVFSRNKFPQIKNSHYTLTLSGYDYYWFHMMKKDAAAPVHPGDVPIISVNMSFEELIGSDERTLLNGAIMEYMKRAKWFPSKLDDIQGVSIQEAIDIGAPQKNSFILLLRVDFIEKISENYILPIASLQLHQAEKILSGHPESYLAKLRNGFGEFIIYEGIYDNIFRLNLLNRLSHRKVLRGDSGSLEVHFISRLKKILSDSEQAIAPSEILKEENNFVLILYGDTVVLKLYRKFEEGINPGIEVLRYLNQNTFFANVPPFAGEMSYRQNSSIYSLGLLKEHISNQGTTWNYFSDAFNQYLENMLTQKEEVLKNIETASKLFFTAESGIDKNTYCAPIEEIHLEMISILGKRTGELHYALSSGKENPDFIPESFSLLYQRSLYQSMRTAVRTASRNLRREYDSLEKEYQKDAEFFFDKENDLLNFFKSIISQKINAKKIRIHGNYHLGQIAFTGKDFVIANFEGMPNSPITERKLKRSPLRDVAGMLWSLRYAAYKTLYKYMTTRTEKIHLQEPLAEQWWFCMSEAYLRSYFASVKTAEFIPSEPKQLDYMLKVYLLEKIIFEVNQKYDEKKELLFLPLKSLRKITEYLEYDKNRREL